MVAEEWSPAEEARLALLTQCEAEVLELLCDGITVRRIAALRGLTEATVRTQVRSILRKLGVDSQLAAVAIHRRAWERVMVAEVEVLAEAVEEYLDFWSGLVPPYWLDRLRAALKECPRGS